jgi:putative Ca2+/H+ antiporter (TMEM165/GDT1 family)
MSALAGPIDLHMEGTMKAFSMVAIAEVFDKTWFVALLMALKYDKVVVFWSCFLGLAAHVALAGIFGAVAANLVPVRLLHFGAAALYAFFAVLFYKDYEEADPDADIIAAGKEEAEEDCEGATEQIEEGKEDNSYGSVDAKKVAKKSELTKKLKLFGACFVAMFIAEWGDRTQIAMIGAASSTPVLAVVVGSLAAFFMLTLSAVIVGGFLGNQKISEKMVHGVSAISFVVFALMAIHDGLDAAPIDMR